MATAATASATGGAHWQVPRSAGFAGKPGRARRDGRPLQRRDPAIWAALLELAEPGDATRRRVAATKEPRMGAGAGASEVRGALRSPRASEIRKLFQRLRVKDLQAFP